METQLGQSFELWFVIERIALIENLVSFFSIIQSFLHHAFIYCVVVMLDDTKTVT